MATKARRTSIRNRSLRAKAEGSVSGFTRTERRYTEVTIASRTIQYCRELRVRMSTATCSLFCVLLLTMYNGAAFGDSDGVLDKIKVGLQYATNYLETARDIADLVSKSLNHKQKEFREKEENATAENAQETFAPSSLVSAFFRLLGLDSQKVAAIAVNSVIFLAQMISSLFGVTPSVTDKSRTLEDDETRWDPVKYILENKNERIQHLVEQAQDVDLPDQLIDRIDGLDSACIRLFLCKTTPIIKAAQDSLINKTKHEKYRLTAWLPAKEEFEANGDECESKHNDCMLFPNNNSQ